MNTIQLKKCIERIRSELHKLSKEKNFSSEEMIKKSKQLDKLLNLYQKSL